MNQIEGIIIGYEDKDEEPSDESNDGPLIAELTPAEQEVYDMFKADLDIEHLINLDPISIARLYSYAGIEGVYEVEYALYSQNNSQMTKEKHIAIPVNDRGKKEEKIKMYNHIREGTFIQTNNVDGYITFNMDNFEMSFRLEKNDDGNWLVSFLPIQ